MASGYVCKNARRALLLFGLTLAGGLSLLSPCPASAQDITTGLVGRWTMDEGSGATLSDSSGSGNNGTWSDSDDNNITGETVAGQISNALTFDGSNDYVDVGSTTILDNVTEASVCFWMYYIPASVTTDGAVIGEYNGSTQDGWFFWVDDAAAATGHTNTMSWSPDTHNGGTWQPGRVEGSTDLVTPGQWDHYCGTFSGGNYIRLYKNGVLDAENTTSIVAEVPTSIQTLRMGSISTGGRYLNARLDDVRVYARALTDTDVLALYAYGVSDTTTGLVGHWTFDDGGGTTVADSSGNGYDGTFLNSPTWVAGHINGALNFDRTASQAVMLPDDIFDGLSEGTVAGWINWTTSTDYRQVISSAAAGQWFEIAILNGRIYLWSDASCTPRILASTEVMSSGTWHHIAYTTDAGGNNFYIDGVPATTVTYTSGDATSNTFYNQCVDSSGATQYGIGWTGSAGDPEYFDGSIDDLRVYSRALSAADIAALYTGMGPQCSNPSGMAGEITYNTDLNVLQYCNGGNWVAVGPSIDLSNGLVGHWGMDEGSGATAADPIGGNDFTLNNMEADDWVTGAVGQGVKFDDSTEYLSVANPGIIGGEAEATICTWLNYIPASVTTDGSMVAQYSGGGWLFFVDNVGWISGRQNTITFTPDDGTAQIEGSEDLVTPGQWDHFCVTFEGSQELRLYKNGVLDMTETASVPAVMDINAIDLTIGRTASGARPLNAQVDDVRIYNRILSPSEMSALYAMGSSSYSAPSATLAGHWTLDETSGASLADSSGNGNTGTWTDNDDNDVTGETVAGMNGTAINFDGVDDIVNAGNDPSLQITGDQTWAAWIYADSFNPGGTDDIFIAKSTTTGSGLAYQFKATEDCGGQHLGIQITSDGIYGPTAATQCSATTLVTNTWYHLTAVYSASGPSLHVYVNGVLDDGGTRGSTIPSAIHDSAAPVTLGATANSAFIFDGIIDDARIYSSALGPNEIYSLYCATGGTCPGSTTSCTGPDGLAGEIVFNTDYDVMQYCNGSAWIAMGPPGDGGAACGSPAGLAGELRYDADSSVLIYCEGDDWVVVNGHVP